MKGGERGADVLIKVPVGTIVREIQRHDPVEILLKEAEEAESALEAEIAHIYTTIHDVNGICEIELSRKNISRIEARLTLA